VKGINIDPKTQAESCGLSNPFPGSHDSNIYYETNMLQAQWALNVVINSPQDLTRALKRADLIAAIGAGIGNNAAHEIAHQFFQDTSGMDDNSIGTYNGQGCDGSRDPWVYTGLGTDKNKTPIHWEDITDKAWKKTLGNGWHQ
jgi:hypothetical protein